MCCDKSNDDHIKLVGMFISIRWQQFVQGIINKQGLRCDVLCLGMNIRFSPFFLIPSSFLQVYLFIVGYFILRCPFNHINIIQIFTT